jgi:hypothetical protein
MRIAIASLTLLSILTAGLAAAGAAFAGELNALAAAVSESGGAGAGDDGQFMVPKWRLAVRTYGNDNGNPAIGVYHRVGTRHEFGLAIDADLDFRNENRTYASGDTSSSYYRLYDDDVDTFDVTIYSELRRWNRISDKLMWYVGPRLALGYRYSDDEHSYEDLSRYRSESWRYTLGLLLSAGADLTLLKRLSLTAGFVPVGVTHTWLRGKSGSVSASGLSHSRTSNDTHVLTLDLHPYATAYLCLTF